jgi:hypothetical protein
LFEIVDTIPNRNQEVAQFNMVWGKPQGIEDIVERLRRNDPSMKSLYLMKHRKFSELDAETLSGAVSESSTLVELNLSSHYISPAMARNLASGLKKNKSIGHISIGNSRFGDEVRPHSAASY